jgi:hypothetical protein
MVTKETHLFRYSEEFKRVEASIDGEHWFVLNPKYLIGNIDTKEIDGLREKNDELRHLLKEQLKISGKCCYAKAPAYAQIRQKLIELGYGPEIITEILGEEV